MLGPIRFGGKVVPLHTLDPYSSVNSLRPECALDQHDHSTLEFLLPWILKRTHINSTQPKMKFHIDELGHNAMD